MDRIALPASQGNAESAGELTSKYDAVDDRRNALDSECATPRLLPKHRDELHNSGLTDSTIQTWGCSSIDISESFRLKHFGKGVSAPGLALPIFPPGSLEPVGFAYKPDHPRTLGKNGKTRTVKYELARRAIGHVHVPLAAQWLFQPPDGREGPLRVVITEGQKKAEKASQEGIGCIALLGVWNWFANFGEESVPLAELADVDWPRYSVEICFDNDAAKNPNIRRAERALARWLRSRGAARVFIVRLPQEGDTKIGLDDYLLAHSVSEFEALPRHGVDEFPLMEAIEAMSRETEKKERNGVLRRIVLEEGDAAERERLLKLVAKLTGISVQAIRKSADLEARRHHDETPATPVSPKSSEELERLERQQQANVDTILLEADRSVTLRAQTWTAGTLLYVCTFGEKSLVLSSTGEARAATDLSEGVVIVEPPDRSPISVEGIRRFRDNEGVLAVSLFEELRNCFARHAIFKHPSVSSALALWSLGTYSYTIFNYYGYLWFTSLGPSHGKSLVEKILSMLCFNSSSPITAPTPSALFRDAETNGETMILDEIEGLDPERKGDVIAILNAGFERGGTVPRSIPKGDGWKTRRFGVYCPKAIAGLSRLPRTLETRVFQIVMPKRKPSERIDSFEPDRLIPWAQKMKDDQAILALRNAPRIAEMYARRSELVPSRPGVDDRLRDILAPLYCLAAIIDGEAGDLVVTAELDQFAAWQARLRGSDTGSEDNPIAAHALFNWGQPRVQSGKLVIQTVEAVELFKFANLSIEPAAARALLRALGGRNGTAWREGKAIRGYVFDLTELQDLVDRNPLSAEVTQCAEEKR